MEPSNPSTCEAFELSLSAMIDGELESPEQLLVIDHLLACAPCRDFYRQARALGSLVMSESATQAVEPAPLEVWDRIVTETGLQERERLDRSGAVLFSGPWLRRHRHVPRALGLAAALVVAVGLWLLRPTAPDTRALGPADDSDVVEVVLEQDKGAMSDERFLELTTEILKADRGYHRKMLEIMSVVDDMAVRPEGSGDESTVVARDRSRFGAAGEEGGDDTGWNGNRL